jgi:hypothetical protein
VLFSDHGMVSVTGTVDVSSAIASTGLVAGRDYVVFLDSTMARFWFPTDVARPAIVEALSTLPGRVLGLRDLRRLDIDECDPRNGELYFLAEPGHVIIPNFFQATADHTRGMHGCEPECPDNMGIFLVHRGDGTTAVDLGVVGPTAVYHALRESLDLPAASNRPASTLAPVSSARREFTQHPDPRAAATIRRHMQRIVKETLQVVARATIVLTGSFGRDEGGVRQDPDGVFVPVNDYDILVVAPDSSTADADALQALGERLAGEFRTDFVHFSVWPDLQQALTPTMANFDLRYGSRVLHGAHDVLASLPEMARRQSHRIEAGA